jgi:Tfp pilus assembly protein PilN
MRVIIIGVLLLASIGFAAEPPTLQPAPTEVLELRKALFESQIQNLANAIREIERELEKRKAAEKETKDKK